MLKGVFFVQEERILEKRGAHPLKYPDILCLLEYLCFFTENIFFSHRTHSGPSPNPSSPAPPPPPPPGGGGVICEVTPTRLPIGVVGSFFSHRGHSFLSQRTFLSLTEDIPFSHRAHRVHGAFWRTFRVHRRPPAYRVHRALLLMLARIRDNK